MPLTINGLCLAAFWIGADLTRAPLLTNPIRFGDVTLHPASAEIDRDGIRQRLPDQAFEVLELLASRPAELVTREELIARLWPAKTFIDTHAGLNTAIKKLRVALGDDADRPKYVETIPRRGYRFVARVEPVDSAAAPAPLLASAPLTPSVQFAAVASPVVAPTPSRRAPSRHRSILFGALAIMLAGAVVTWQARVAPPSSPQGNTAPSAPSSRNVAVLPFLNLTGDPGQDYLALGLAENVLHQLAQLPDLNVIAHTSSFQFREPAGDVRELGRKLNARYLLEGSVQTSATRMRVTTQLIDATSGSHLWSMSFDRSPKDLLATEDEIALQVARALQVGGADSHPGSIHHSGTLDSAAWLALQQGRALSATRNYHNLEEAVANLERAVHLDPQFANAYVELANAYLLRGIYTLTTSDATKRELLRRAASQASAAADRALAIDPALGEALIMRAMARLVAWDATEADWGLFRRGMDQLGGWKAAEADFRAGLALSPNSARGHQMLGELLIDYAGRNEEGVALIERARLLDPLEPRGPYYLGFFELRRGNISEAERQLLAALELRPDYAPALRRMAWLNWMWRGSFADAIKYSEAALQADPQRILAVESVPSYLELGEQAAAFSLLFQADAPYAPLVRLYAGNSSGAAALLYANPARYDACDSSMDSFSIMEDARAVRNYARARRFLEQNAGIAIQDAKATVPPGSEHAATVLAQLLEWSGEHVHARRLVEVALTQLDRARETVIANCVNVARTRARALALLGREAESIEAMKRALMEQNAWYEGWYLFERDPAFAPLRANPEFHALQASYRQRVAGGRERLAQLRAEGLIPARP